MAKQMTIYEAIEKQIIEEERQEAVQKKNKAITQQNEANNMFNCRVCEGSGSFDKKGKRSVTFQMCTHCEGTGQLI